MIATLKFTPQMQSERGRVVAARSCSELQSERGRIVVARSTNDR